jgi:hypothetical protein
MQWFRAGRYTLKTVAGEKFIYPVPTKFKGGDLKEHILLGGGVVYQVDDVRKDLILDFLNITSVDDVMAFASKYGLLGLYWYYQRVDNIPLRLMNSSLEDIFGGEVSKTLIICRNVGLESPPLDIWRYYREPAGLILREAKKYRDFAKKLLRGESPGEMAAVTHITFVGGRPYWVPDAATLIEYIYTWLPILLAEGHPLRVCENEKCSRFFVDRKSRHCSTKCKNRQNQRESRQRETIIDRLGRGMSLEEAAAGLDMEKVRKWLEKGLIYYPERR